MIEHKRIVLTGGPSTGKTSLLKHINADQIKCFSEVSREVIRKAQVQGFKNPFLDNPLEFSKALFKERLKDYLTLSVKPIHMYDRGIHDVVAYLYAIGHEVPSNMDKECKKNKYNIVFILPPWEEIFHQDKERLENFNEAQKYHYALIETYQSYGMNCIEVPKSNITNRIEFILYNL
jgi:predicted ATPase